jgi:hypothetical protein
MLEGGLHRALTGWVCCPLAQHAEVPILLSTAWYEMTSSRSQYLTSQPSAQTNRWIAECTRSSFEMVEVGGLGSDQKYALTASGTKTPRHGVPLSVSIKSKCRYNQQVYMIQSKLLVTMALLTCSSLMVLQISLLGIYRCRWHLFKFMPAVSDPVRLNPFFPR